MTKKFLLLFIMIIFIIGINGAVYAVETTSTVNGVNVNWTYSENSSNQIEKLRCSNPTELTGEIQVPATLDGKTVISIGDGAFKSSKITKVTIPNTIKEISYDAFKNCTSLTNVNLGKIESISFRAFEGCTGLTSVTIPKTLKSGSLTEGIFRNCPNLRTIILEDGMTEIADGICADTNITSIAIPNTVTTIKSGVFKNCTKLTEITIPDSVKSISYDAFKNCTSLTNVNLGKIESISFRAFEGCTGLTNITIPNTLKSGPTNSSVFNGCTNLTTINLENGMTKIAEGICANTNISSINIPNTVKDIGIGAFEGCKNLTEVVVPNSVKTISNKAFKDCTKLNKITIPDSIKNMDWEIAYFADGTFANHNSDLTIYCYEESEADKYAKKYNIKHVYLTKEENNESQGTEQKGDKEQNGSEGSTTNGEKKESGKDSTTIPDKTLPKTGINLIIIFGVLVVAVITIASYKKYRNLKDVK